MDRLISSSEMPMGLGMALAENFSAMRYFASLDEATQKQIIARTHDISSKQEMRQYVRDLSKMF